MIDGLFKKEMDRFWDRFGRLVARTGLTPNAITIAGFALCTGNALAFVWHQNLIAFGLLVGAIELLDNVDGAVARVSGRSSLLGAYLDATTDRYKDFFILLAIAWVSGYWLPCMLATAGSLITSYNHARAAMLGLADDAPDESGRKPFPDLFERLERIATLCVGLVLTPLLPPIAGQPLLFWTVWIVAIMTALTSVQRFVSRARRLARMERDA
jgi:phosphatidylglycerophosphate synthase